MVDDFNDYDVPSNQAVIKVIGVGGGGCNAVEHMLNSNITGVEFISANTDAQALSSSSAPTKIQMGLETTRGLGAGANPAIGESAALESKEIIEEAIQGADMLFIAAGMGGGTGTGAAPVIAEISRKLGILTVAVVTKPFSFERKKRMAFAEKGIDGLNGLVDSLIILPNDKLLKEKRGLALKEAFSGSNDVLKGAVQGIAELITSPGLINVDFADVRTVMSTKGSAMMGTGVAEGNNRAFEAVNQALKSPLLEGIEIEDAKGILINVTAGPNLSIDEFGDIGDAIEEIASDDATVVIGTAIDDSMGEALRVTVVATGIGMESEANNVAHFPSSSAPAAIRPGGRPAESGMNPRLRESRRATAEPSSVGQPSSTRVERRDPVINEDERSQLLDIPSFLKRKKQ